MHINHTLILASLAIGSFALAVPYDGSTSTALAKRQAEQNNNGPDEADTPPENPLDPAEQEDQADLSPQANDPSDPTYQGPDGIEPEQTRNINTNADSQNGGDADEDDDDDDDNMDEETRLAQEAQETWDNIPTLPPNLLEAVDWQTRVEVLAMARAFAEMGNIQKLRDPAFGLMRMRKPFLSRGRTRLIVDNTINQVRQVDRSGESIDDLLEEKLSALDVDTLERQLEEMLEIRFEIEGEPDFSAEEAGILLPTPLAMLTQGQDRMLIIAKARAGLANVDQLAEYLMARDPYVSEQRLVRVVRQTLEDFSTPSADFTPLLTKPSALQRAWGGLKRFFGKSERPNTEEEEEEE